LLPPVSEFKHYRVMEWLNYVATEIHKGMSILFNPGITAEQKETIFMPLIKKKFTFLDNHLANNKYLLGNDFTLPDAYLFVILGWAVHFKIDLAPWKNLSRYIAELMQRKSVMESLKQEKLVPA
jgi:glutathione S-transferase